MEGLPPIEPYRRKYEEIDARMAAPDFFSDRRRAATLSREHQKLGEMLALHKRLQDCRRRMDENDALIRDPATEDELKELAAAELEELEDEAGNLKEKILFAMIPPDEADSRNTILEIRAGAGGDEASLFAGDLYRMYCRYAELRGWKVETLSVSESECGGFKEVVFLVSGEDVHKNLKFESGVHRVQRIPVTEAGGRIHTSTVTVAVLPEAEEVDVAVLPEDLEITVSRASGAGGQHVNTTDSAVQILHKPTGMIVHCADERSQHKNRAKAMTVLRSRLLQQKEEEERARYAADRRNQVGTGDRSERIRTYNFPQSRLTDHRIGLTLHNLSEVLEGNLDTVIAALQDADYRARVESLVAGG